MPVLRMSHNRFNVMRPYRRKIRRKESNAGSDLRGLSRCGGQAHGCSRQAFSTGGDDSTKPRSEFSILQNWLPADSVDFCGACHSTWWDTKLSGVKAFPPPVRSLIVWKRVNAGEKATPDLRAWRAMIRTCNCRLMLQLMMRSVPVVMLQEPARKRPQVVQAGLAREAPRIVSPATCRKSTCPKCTTNSPTIAFELFDRTKRFQNNEEWRGS